MSLNVIVRKGPKLKISADEQEHNFRQYANKLKMAEDAGRQERMAHCAREADKAREKGRSEYGVTRLVTPVDDFFRREAESPGCMSDKNYLKDIHRQHPELRGTKDRTW